MGEVYRAHDTRLRRDVALKVLRPSLASPEYVERLSREARAAGSLNHPNILAVFDVGTEGAVPYVVSELLEGESLRQRLDRGPIPYRKALEYGIHIALALAAAHDKGIRHRDVKPANVFITTDGRVKLLDFGLAKLQRAEAPGGMDDITASMATRSAVIRGTAGYMAPEQILGEPVDARADVFGLGAVLYEMFTGQRAFGRPSTVETQSAVLNDDPSDPLDLNPALPRAAAAAVRRCLEKNREGRFQSAADLAFHLQQIEHLAIPAPPARYGREWARRNLRVAGLVLAAIVATGWLMWQGLRPPDPPTFHQYTFHRGRIGGARFSGEGIVYSQAIGGAPSEVRLVVPGSPESRSLGYIAADVLAARGGDLALSSHRRFAGAERFIGTLAVVSVGGGTPAERLENVEDADWSAASGEFAVALTEGVGEPSTLEYPIGRKLYASAGRGSIHFPRISRDGRRVAFLEDPGGVGARGRVVVVDGDGAYKVLTEEWASARGLSWSSRGDEVWFTAAKARGNRALWAVDLDERQRLVLETPGSLTIWDTAPDGKVLLTRDDERRALVGKPPGGNSELDLSWFDDAGLASLSPDGQQVLFGDRFGGIYLRRTDGAPAVKVDSKEAYADALSPDGSLVLATTMSVDQLLLLPTGPAVAGSSAARYAPSPRTLAIPGITSFSGSRWFPDGGHIVFSGAEPGHKLRSYVLDLSGGAPRALTPEGTWVLSISNDGKLAAATSHGKPITLHPVDGGPSRTVAGSEADDRPVAWSDDGGSLWVFKRDQTPTDICRLDIVTGQRSRWKRLAPPDPAGVYPVSNLAITPSGNAYFYNYRRVLSELYVATGLK
jgi:Tol biopolymer transport system component